VRDALDPQDVAVRTHAGQERVRVGVIVLPHAQNSRPCVACGPPLVPSKRPVVTGFREPRSVDCFRVKDLPQHMVQGRCTPDLRWPSAGSRRRQETSAAVVTHQPVRDAGRTLGVIENERQQPLAGAYLARRLRPAPHLTPKTLRLPSMQVKIHAQAWRSWRTALGQASR